MKLCEERHNFKFLILKNSEHGMLQCYTEGCMLWPLTIWFFSFMFPPVMKMHGDLLETSTEPIYYVLKSLEQKYDSQELDLEPYSN
jgi:hypothetical protein